MISTTYKEWYDLNNVNHVKQQYPKNDQILTLN